MDTLINDLQQIIPFITVVLTSLIVLVVEARKSTLQVISAIITVAGLIVSVITALATVPQNREILYGMLYVGSFGNYISIVIAFIGIFAVALSVQYYPKFQYNRGEFYSLLLFAVQGMMLLSYANDLIIVFLAIELLSVPLYALSGLFRTNERSIEAALKYFLLGAFSTGFLLFGIALIYGATGTTTITQLERIASAIITKPLFLTGCTLLIVGILFKLAAVPFHMWAPDAYEGAPTPVTGFMAAGVKVAVFALFALLTLKIFGYSKNIGDAMAIISALSMIIGNILAIAQKNIKRMMAYSSIAHVGYILTGIAAMNREGAVGAMYYSIIYAMMTIGVFAVIAWNENTSESTLSLDSYNGFSVCQPYIAAVMAAFMFAFAGVPPFAGFFGKYSVFLAAVKANMVWLAVVGVITSVISAYYYLRIVVLMYFREGEQSVTEKPTILTFAILSITTILVLATGIFPSLILNSLISVF